MGTLTDDFPKKNLWANLPLYPELALLHKVGALFFQCKLAKSAQPLVIRGPFRSFAVVFVYKRSVTTGSKGLVGILPSTNTSGKEPLPK